MYTVILAVFILILSGCGGHYAPVRDGTLGAAEIPVNGKHTVQAGESLYTIAWRYHRDIQEIAALNTIQPPYTIYPGQELQITGEAPVVVAAIEPVPQFNDSVPVVTEESVPQNINVLPEVQPTVTQQSVQNKSSVVTSPPVVNAPVKNWLWPAQGKVIGTFGRKNKGIDIAGQIGEPVYATASGQVVYSGTGLRGYGRLIIIKHNAEYLSAYAHNHRLLVTEGETVTQGQKIAEMGDSGTNVVKLHFELRFHGKPVDPQKHLPPR